MFGKLGLGGKLGLAFIVIAGLPTLAGVLGLLEMRGLSRLQSDVINQTIPAIADVRGMTEESTRIIAIAPELAEVGTQAERRDRAAFLSEQVAALTQRLDQLENVRGISTRGLRESVTTVEHTVRELDQLVAQRIREHQELTAQAAANLDIATELLHMADTLVANAEMSTTAVISSLYGPGTGAGTEEAGQEERTATLDKLIEVDLFQLGLMFELRSRSAEIGLLINRIDAAVSDIALGEIDAALVGHLSVIKRRVRAIRDPVRREQAIGFVETLRSGTTGPSVLIERRLKILAFENRITTLKQSLQTAALQLGDEAATLADQAQAQALAAGELATQEAQRAQVTNGFAALGGFVLSLAVLWVFVRGNITRRLDQLSGAMTALAGGMLDRQVTPAGQDEIAQMEEAVEVFRRQAIAKRDLEKERDRNERELLEHRNNLQQMVAEQTEMLRLEVEAHDQARREAERADKAKSEFLALMSHEIRTPMNGVLGMLRGLSEEPMTPDQARRLQTAHASSQNLLKILNGILDYSKAEGGALELEEVSFSLSGLLNDIVVLMRPGADEKGIHLWLDMPGDLPQAVLGDEAKLRQILFNLLSNAVKFTDEGEVILRVRLQGDAAQGYATTLEVSDTGAGIADAAKDRIFQAFEQEDGHTSRTFGGTGLGLAICSRFARAMGAKLTVESTKGVGSVFSLSMVLKPGDPDQIEQSDKPPAVVRAGAPLKVLVVEDNEINQMVARGYLERMGHCCTCVALAEKALEMLQREAFDVVLMDVNLPGISGTEAMRRLRAAPRSELAKLPIIAISAHVQEDQIDALLAAGFTGFVAKPVSPERLSKALEGAVRGQSGHVYLSARHDSGGQAALRQTLRDVIDRNIRDLGLRRAGEVTDMFETYLPEELENLRQSHAGGDWQDVQRIAHRMKGAVGNFDMTALARQLSQLEAAAKDGQHDRIDEDMRAISDLAGQVQSALAELSERPDQLSAAVKT